MENNPETPIYYVNNSIIAIVRKNWNIFNNLNIKLVYLMFWDADRSLWSWCGCDPRSSRGGRSSPWVCRAGDSRTDTSSCGTGPKALAWPWLKEKKRIVKFNFSFRDNLTQWILIGLGFISNLTYKWSKISCVQLKRRNNKENRIWMKLGKMILVTQRKQIKKENSCNSYFFTY